MSVNAYASVVFVYNETSALYCVINNHFCVIRVSFVTTSQLACRWMCDSPRTGCAWRHTPTYMWREYAKAKAHIHGRREDFFQWVPLGNFSKIFLLRGPKWWNLIFPTRNWENSFLLLKFSKSMGGLDPPSDAHARIYVMYVNFWELMGFSLRIFAPHVCGCKSSCIPKRSPMGPLQQSFPPLAQSFCYATGCYVAENRWLTPSELWNRN